MPPGVSVLTPSFQQSRWLEDNLNSVEAQTYGHIEHIVIDGGSTDGSIDVLRSRERDGLMWKSGPDAGQSDALNKAFALSSGEIIGWLNSDDAYFGPTVVEEAVAIFASDPDVAVVYGHAALVNGAGLILQVLWAPPFNRDLLRLHDYIVQPAAFIRRSAVGARFVDPTFDFTMDYELFLRLARQHRFRRLDRIVAIDRHHRARKSYTLTAIGASDTRRLIASYGVLGGVFGTAGRKVWKIVSRLLGTRLVRAASSERTVFTTARDGGRSLLVRQIATFRSQMDPGDG